ncbi:DUF5641 domain-containing protein [Trichonephila clavipes]|nr:DUF5641 domain-containing protein [Trichonephila clavipes]
MNIADLLSRGCSPRQMLSSRWWEGPSWLKQNSEYWPDGEISCEPQEVNVERKKTKKSNVDLANDAPPLLICNVSDYDKMIRVFTWILRFVNNCRKDYKKCKEHELSAAEIENSEKQLIRLTQTYYLPDVESLKFVTFIDNDNILRVKSKITERNDESSFLYPILLPDKSKIIELIPGRNGEIRTVRLKTQHGTVIRPMQRIFPLEVQAIANSDKELKEESISVKSTKPEKVLNTNDVIIKKYTSSGRLVKEPKRERET